MNSQLTRKTGLYGVVGLVLVGSVVLLATSGPLLGTACTTIDEPGRYELTSDVTNSNDGRCIEITASNVILDGQGPTIDGNASSNGVGVFVHPNDTTTGHLSNVTVTNLIVTDWDYGIAYRKTTGGRITNTNSSSNDKDGISVDDSDTTTLSNNTASSNNRIGIKVDDSERTTVSNNTVTENGLFGISVSESKTTTLSNNTVTENIGNGIGVDRSERATLLNNTVTGDEVGIDMTNASNTAVTGNVLTGNDKGLRIDSRSTNTTTSNNTLKIIEKEEFWQRFETHSLRDRWSLSRGTRRSMQAESRE